MISSLHFNLKSTITVIDPFCSILKLNLDTISKDSRFIYLYMFFSSVISLETTVDFKLVKGKCQVTYSENLKSLDEYFSEGLDRFFFTEVKKEGRVVSFMIDFTTPACFLYTWKHLLLLVPSSVGKFKTANFSYSDAEHNTTMSG